MVKLKVKIFKEFLLIEISKEYQFELCDIVMVVRCVVKLHAIRNCWKILVYLKISVIDLYLITQEA